MNFKFIVVSIGLFLALISNGVENKQTENIVSQNELNVTTQNTIKLVEIKDENTCVEENTIDIDDNEEIKEKNRNIENDTKDDEQKNVVQNTQTIQNNIKPDNEKKEIREEKSDEIIQPESKSKELTSDDLEYWCIAGGNHHVAGDGQNEHGYYNTWDEAYNAFLNYTAEWSSSQYKVSCCSCGLYYFWATN